MKIKKKWIIFKNVRLRQKYLISYSLILAVSLSITLILTYQKTIFIIKNQIIHSSELIIDSIKDNVNKKITTAIDVSNAIYSNIALQDIMNKANTNSNYQKIEQYEDMCFIQEFIKMFDSMKDIYKVKIFVRDGLIYSNENHSLFNIKTIENTVIYNKIISKNGKIYWMSPYMTQKLPYDLLEEKDNVVTAGRLIKNFRNLNNINGIVFVDILKEDFDNILADSVVENHISYITDDVGNIISSSYKSNVEKNENLMKFNKSLSLNLKKWSNVKFNGNIAIITYEKIPETNWKIYYLVPIKYLKSAYIDIEKYLLLVFGLTLFVMVFMTYKISNKDVKRIEKILHFIRGIKKKEFNERLSVDLKDEIGIIEENLNYMIDEIKILLEQHYNAGLKIKNAEYKLLQAQINPHFLYNTLELVNWMAINRDVFDISELIQKLTRYYRLSLSKGAEVITIKDEVEHALTYLDIQNKRFDNCAKIIVNINERILECKVIKVILQPIVENAFYHGILEKYNEKGTISIRGILHDGIISIFVEDDGVGMSKEKVNSILSFKKNDTESGYGVLNTHNRLKLQYGNQYGLNYTSIEGKKTIVEIRIPEIR